MSDKMVAQTEPDSCAKITLQDVHFKKSKVFLDEPAKLSLDSTIDKLQQYPGCRIKVISCGNASEEGQQISWDKTVSVIDYLIEKGINKKRIIFSFGQYGDPQIARIKMVDEDGPVWMPPPMPCYSYLKKYSGGGHRCRHPHGRGI